MQSIIGVAQGAVHVRTGLLPAFATVPSQSVFWGQSLRIGKVESGIRHLELGLWNQDSGIRNLESGRWNLESGLWNKTPGIRNL